MWHMKFVLFVFVIYTWYSLAKNKREINQIHTTLEMLILSVYATVDPISNSFPFSIKSFNSLKVLILLAHFFTRPFKEVLFSENCHL